MTFAFDLFRAQQTVTRPDCNSYVEAARFNPAPGVTDS